MRASDCVARRRVTFSCAALASCALWCARAEAQVPPIDVGDVQLSIPDCEDIPGTQIATLVELELAPHQTTPTTRAQSAVTRASVRCAAEHATITVEDPRRANPLVLEVALAATPKEARARLVALAIAELIATSRLERVEAPVAAEEPPPPPPPSPPSPLAPRPDHRFELFLEAGVTRALEPALFEPALAAGVSLGFAPFALMSDIAYERGETSTPDATVTAHSLSLSLAPAWPVTYQNLTLSLALGLRGGYALLDASPRQAGLVGHNLSGVFLAPIAGASLQLDLTDHWAARLALEFGYVVKPVRGLDADQAALLELRGVRMGALLGVAWSP